MVRAVKDKPTTKRTPRTRRTASRVNPEKTEVAGAGVPLASHRLRQASVSAILDATFGAWAESNPELWERRAYLLLVGLVYERLATNEDEVSTDELIKLGKALAENRRADARTRKSRADDDGHSDATDDKSDPDSNGKLPTRFADLIRQVYGAKVNMPDSGDSDGAAK